MPVAIVLIALLGLLAIAGPPRRFTTVIPLETTSETSANVSMGDLDGDGDLDIVLAKGRHDPLIDRVLLNDGNGRFVASNLGPDADRTYTAALADVDADGDLDVLTSNDTPDRKLVFLNNGKGQFTVAGTWGVGEVVDAECRGCRPERRRPAGCDRGQSSGAELRLPESRRRPVRDRLHRRFRPSRRPPSCPPTSIATAFIDLAVPARDGGPNQIFFNDGKAGFARTLDVRPARQSTGASARPADFDGTGTA